MPSEARKSFGHSTEFPVQVSTTSHAPARGRHVMVDGTNLSTGQAVETPVQVSTTSHAPARGRHIVPPGFLILAGHTADNPVQWSTTSHTSTAARHTAPVDIRAQLPSVVPPAATLQARQSAVSLSPQDVLQHTPSVQYPLLHCAADLHGNPFDRARAKMYAEPLLEPLLSALYAPAMAVLPLIPTEAPKRSSFLASLAA
jgi:hypothetical protein